MTKPYGSAIAMVYPVSEQFPVSSRPSRRRFTRTAVALDVYEYNSRAFILDHHCELADLERQQSGVPLLANRNSRAFF